MRPLRGFGAIGVAFVAIRSGYGCGMGLTDSIVGWAVAPARLSLRAGEKAIGAAIDVLRGARSVLGRDGDDRGASPPTAGSRGPTSTASAAGAPPAGAPSAGARLEPDAPADTTVPPHGDAVAPPGASAAPSRRRRAGTARTPAARPGDAALEGVPATGPEGEAMPVGPPPAGAKRVDDEPVSAGEFGGPGAEEDAGAEVHVDPPWEHYDDMTAAQISDRLRAADSGLAAAVSLYESSGRARKSVVAAAEARLRALDAAPPRS